MEALEQQAFEALCKKSKVEQPAKGLKRPAAAKAKAKTMPVSKAKAVPVSKAAAKAKAAGKPCATLKNLRGTTEVLGCPRCRGNWRGCKTCANHLYHGIRLAGRSAWKSYMERKQGTNKKK